MCLEVAKPHHHSRRTFLQKAAIGASLICAFGPGWKRLLGAAKPTHAGFDLLVKGGKVIDPSQQLSGLRDIGIRDGKVAAVEENISDDQAIQVLDAHGRIVTPGLIDVHVHVYEGVAPLGIPADPNCIAKGVTTVVDAGSAGAHTFPGFRRHVVNVVDTRVFALLNISVVGQSTLSLDNPFGELLNLGYANPQLAIRTIERNRDVILGVKVRLSRNIAGDHDLEALKLAKEAASAVGLPLMIHIGDTHTSLPVILSELTKGDVVTHSFRGGEGGILDDRGKVLKEVRSAMARGIHFDVGHGAGSFSFDTAEKALKQDVVPGTISSDVHQFNINGPVFDLATTLSKFLYLGLTLDEVIQRATTNPAHLFGFPKGLGSLRVGADADIALFSLIEGDFQFEDALKQTRLGHQKLVPVATVKAGRIYGSAVIPVVRAG
ncbi:MAG: amidohydrolase/deacetylase family metallohydrolase [Acidobacteriota bacterium]